MRWDPSLLNGSKWQTVAGGQKHRVSQDTQTAAASCCSADQRKTFWSLSFLWRLILTLDPNRLAVMLAQDSSNRLAGNTAVSVCSFSEKAKTCIPSAQLFSAISPHLIMPRTHGVPRRPTLWSVGWLTSYNSIWSSSAGETQWPRAKKRKK